MTSTTNARGRTSTDETSAAVVVRAQLGFAAQHGSAELTAITAGTAGVLALGVVSSMAPEIELALTWLLAIALVLAAVTAAARMVDRWARERAEDRADAAYVAAVQARTALGPGGSEVPDGAAATPPGERFGGVG